MVKECVTRRGRGQGRRRSAAGRAVLSVAHAPFCPPLAAGGRSVNLNAAFTSQCESRPWPASLYRSVLRRSAFGQLIGEGGAAGRGLGRSGFFGKRCQTLDAMSRRKLGSKPQHLSAIQGKGERRCVGRVEILKQMDVMILGWIKTNSAPGMVLFPVYAPGLDAR